MKQKTRHNYLFRFYYTVNHPVFIFSNHTHRENPLIPVLKKYPHMEWLYALYFVLNPLVTSITYFEIDALQRKDQRESESYVFVIRLVMQTWQQEIMGDWLCVCIPNVVISDWIKCYSTVSKRKLNEINWGVLLSKYRYCDLEYHGSV